MAVEVKNTLPKIAGGEQGEYTMVTKEWSPAMLEHYEYSNVGIDTKPKVDIEMEGWV